MIAFASGSTVFQSKRNNPRLSQAGLRQAPAVNGPQGDCQAGRQSNQPIGNVASMLALVSSCSDQGMSCCYRYSIKSIKMGRLGQKGANLLLARQVRIGS